MTIVKKIDWRKVAILFASGMVGVFSAWPMISALISVSGQEPPLPMFVIQSLSTLQSGVILFAMVILGAYLSSKVNLGAPLVEAWLQNSWHGVNVKQILFAGIVGGLLGCVVLMGFSQFSTPRLPSEFIKNAEAFSPPFYTKILYGGITEELLIRWGLMSFFVWGFFRLTQNQASHVKPVNYWLGILASSFIFGVAHLPAASLLSPVVTMPLIMYIIVGNSLFGLIAGYLYWKKGLESAIIAHILAHVVMAFFV